MFKCAYVELKKPEESELIILILPGVEEEEIGKIYSELLRLNEEGIKIKGSRIIEIAEQGIKILLAEAVKIGHEIPVKAITGENYFTKLAKFQNELTVKFIMCLHEDLTAIGEIIERSNQYNSLFSVVGFGFGYKLSLN